MRKRKSRKRRNWKKSKEGALATILQFSRNQLRKKWSFLTFFFLFHVRFVSVCRCVFLEPIWQFFFSSCDDEDDKKGRRKEEGGGGGGGGAEIESQPQQPKENGTEIHFFAASSSASLYGKTKQRMEERERVISGRVDLSLSLSLSLRMCPSSPLRGFVRCVDRCVWNRKILVSPSDKKVHFNERPRLLRVCLSWLVFH